MINIQERRLYELAEEMSEAIQLFHYLNCHDSEIKILMPDWLKKCFRGLLNPVYRTPDGLVYASPNPNLEKMEKFQNIEVFPNFENKIIIYHVNFAFYEKLYKPIIILI